VFSIKKIAVTALMSIFIIGQLAFGFTAFASEPSNSSITAEQQQSEVGVTIIGDNGPILQTTAVDVPSGSTILDVLQKAALENHLSVETKGSGENVYVDGINGLHGGDRGPASGWMVYVNGLSIPVSAAVYQVTNHDHIQWEYTTDYTKNQKVDARLTIIGKDGKPIVSNVKRTTEGHATAYDLLKSIADDQKIPLDVAYSKDFGLYVQNIGTEPLESHDTWGQYWAFYVNGQMASVGASSYVLQPDDNITFKVETWGTNENNGNNGNNENNGNSGNTGNEGSGNGQNGSDGSNTSPVNEPNKVSENEINDILKTTVNHILQSGVDSPWEAVAVHQAGMKVPASYLNDIKQQVIETKGEYRNITDYERDVIGITAAGGDPRDIAGYNLVEKIYNSDYCEKNESCPMTRQGTNGILYALIALDSGNYPVPSNANWTREKLKKRILELQEADGKWTLYNGQGSPVDMTGIAIAALAPYKDEPEVAAAIKRGVDWLSAEQKENGGFADPQLGETSEAASAAIIGLTAAGVDPQGAAFTKKDGNLLSYLIRFYNGAGQFRHTATGDADEVATEQGAEAMVAYQLFADGKGSVYRMAQNPNPAKEGTDNTQMSNNPNTESKNENSGLVTNNSKEKNDHDQSGSKTSHASLGGKLPNTTTNIYNLLLAGIILIIAGVLLYVYNRKYRERGHD